jgi:hypothetical protein
MPNVRAEAARSGYRLWPGRRKCTEYLRPGQSWSPWRVASSERLGLARKGGEPEALRIA